MSYAERTREEYELYKKLKLIEGNPLSRDLIRDVIRQGDYTQGKLIVSLVKGLQNIVEVLEGLNHAIRPSFTSYSPAEIRNRYGNCMNRATEIKNKLNVLLKKDLDAYLKLLEDFPERR